MKRQQALELSYQSFQAREVNRFVFHPYYLKEYRNRWFVLGCRGQQEPLLILALDRIVSIGETDEPFLPCVNKDLPGFFQHVIGVTVNVNQSPEEVLLFVHQQAAPYVLTKPLHQSQQIVEQQSNGIVISLRVQHNYELEQEILAFGDSMKVLAPQRLKRCIKEALSDALDLYCYEISHTTLVQHFKKLLRNGFSIVPHVFTRKETNHMKAMTARYQNQEGNQEKKPVYAIRHLLQAIPGLKNVLFNAHLKAILSAMHPAGGSALFLSKALYFDKPPQSNWSVSWHQDITISVKEKIETEGFFGWTQKEGMIGVCPPEEILKNTLTLRIHLDDTDEQNGALKVIPGSQNKRLNQEEIAGIIQHSLPYTCEVVCGGIHLIKPLLLHASAKTVSGKHRRVIHLEFNSLDLPNGLAWAEKIPL